MMVKPSKDPGIEHEPQYQPGWQAPDPTEWKADLTFAGRTDVYTSDDARAANSVWDEPGMSPELSGALPPEAETWAAHYARRREETSYSKSFLVTVLLAALSAPWAILGVFARNEAPFFAFVAIVIIAPIMEEAMKVALATWAIEVKPWLFKHGFQILFCGFMSGLFFATIENILYLFVYPIEVTPALVAWRWTVCTALHVSCTCLASIGLMGVWRRADATLSRANLYTAFPWLTAAIIVHAAYNFLAITVLEHFLFSR